MQRYSSRCDRGARLPLNNNQGMASEHPSAPTVSTRDRIALYAVNFFMADMEAGMGPFLGVLLQSRGWSTGAIGGVITLGAVVGMLTVTLAGALVDVTTHKRACVIVVGLGAVAAASVILMSGNFWVIAGAQAVMCISGATIAPAVIGITLGLVGQARFNSQNGHENAIGGGHCDLLVRSFAARPPSDYPPHCVTNVPTGFGFKRRPGRLINHQRGRPLGSSNNGPGPAQQARIRHRRRSGHPPALRCMTVDVPRRTL